MGSKKVIKKIKGFFRNYFWARHEYKTCTWVTSNIYTCNRSSKRLSLTNPNDVMNVLLNK